MNSYVSPDPSKVMVSRWCDTPTPSVFHTSMSPHPSSEVYESNMYTGRSPCSCCSSCRDLMSSEMVMVGSFQPFVLTINRILFLLFRVNNFFRSLFLHIWGRHEKLAKVNFQSKKMPRVGAGRGSYLKRACRRFHSAQRKQQGITLEKCSLRR